MPVWLQTLLSNDGYEAIFLVMFLNNAGLPIPGNTFLLATGFLAGTGTLSFWPAAGIATGACFMGTNCGYWLGRRYGRHWLQHIHWFRLTHQRIRHMEHFFKRYGAKGVFFARFVTFLHPVIGLLAGLGKTPGRPFLLYNLIGSALYVVLYIGAGSIFGQRWGFHRLWATHTTLVLLLVIGVLVGLTLYWRHSVFTLFGHPIYRRKRGGFWGN